MQFYLHDTCHSAIPSKQPITDTRKYDRYDDLSVLMRNDEVASSLKKPLAVIRHSFQANQYILCFLITNLQTHHKNSWKKVVIARVMPEWVSEIHTFADVFYAHNLLIEGQQELGIRWDIADGSVVDLVQALNGLQVGTGSMPSTPHEPHPVRTQSITAVHHVVKYSVLEHLEAVPYKETCSML